MTDLVHPYEKLTLVQLGWPIAIYLIGGHLFMLFREDFCKKWLVKLPRHYHAGVIVMSLALGWFWLLVAPSHSLIFPALAKFSMNLAEFNSMKPLLRLAVPLMCVGMCLYVKEFLFVRGLGLLALMVAGPILIGGMFKDEPTRVLLPLFAYVVLTIGLYCVGMPYLFRDAVTWVTAKSIRYRAFAVAGLLYGVMVLVCTLFIW